MPNYLNDLTTTYSIIARDPETGELGGAVQTHQLAVGRIIPVTMAGVGVVASQSLVNLKYNPLAITMLQQDIPPQKIIDALIASDGNAERRQVAVINQQGDVAAFSGAGCIREFGHSIGEGYSVQANMMTNTTVIDAMCQAYDTTTGDLAARMLAALQAAQAEDGDIRGKQSAALKVVSGNIAVPDWDSPYDLRVDEHENPVDELARLVKIRHAQLVNAEGYRLLADGEVDAALAKWQQARQLTPDQEELAFWQLITLADEQPHPDSLHMAVSIFKESLKTHKRHEHWIDLIRRITDNGLIQREGAGVALLNALGED